MNRVILVALTGLAMAGCSSLFPQHACPLPESGATCANMSQAYQAAQTAARNKVNPRPESVMPFGKYEAPSKSWFSLGGLFDSNDVRTAGPAYNANGWTPPANQEVFQGFAQPQESGSPVYTPPRVHRAWSAPWTDAEGRLHGGEYQYFTTAGGWNYGSLKANGQAGSAMMGPLRPSQVGFKVNPVDKSGKPLNQAAERAAPQPTPQQAAPQVPASLVKEKQAYGSGSKTVGNVTQPYTQFGDDEGAR